MLLCIKNAEVCTYYFYTLSENTNEPFKTCLLLLFLLDNDSTITIPSACHAIGFNFISFSNFFVVHGFCFLLIVDARFFFVYILHELFCCIHKQKPSLSRIQIYSQWQSVNELTINNWKSFWVSLLVNFFFFVIIDSFSILFCVAVCLRIRFWTVPKITQ